VPKLFPHSDIMTNESVLPKSTLLSMAYLMGVALEEDGRNRTRKTHTARYHANTNNHQRQRLRQREQKKHVGHTTEGKRGEQQEGTYLLEHSSKLMSG
jgi:hypothetical protein